MKGSFGKAGSLHQACRLSPLCHDMFFGLISHNTIRALACPYCCPFYVCLHSTDISIHELCKSTVYITRQEQAHNLTSPLHPPSSRLLLPDPASNTMSTTASEQLVIPGGSVSFGKSEVKGEHGCILHFDATYRLWANREAHDLPVEATRALTASLVNQALSTFRSLNVFA